MKLRPERYHPCLNRIALFFLLCLFYNKAQAQLKPDQPYNRFQYHKYKWRVFHTTDFHIYFTQGSDSICSFIAKELPNAIKQVKHNMAASVMRVPNIVVYPSTDQLYESNIGLYETEPNTLPTFIIKGTRLILAYNGDYDNLRSQLYEAIARELWESQLREGLADQAKGVLGNEDIPFWYKEGAIKYLAVKWPIQAEDELRRSYEKNNFTDWQQSIAYQPRLSGQAFCYFLTEKYYPLAAMNLFSQLRKKKTLARASRLITKRSLDTLYAQCNTFYKQRFAKKDSSLVATVDTNLKFRQTVVPYKKGIVKNVQASNDGQHIAYVISKNNKRTVYLYHIQNKQTDKLSTYSLPPWINDYSQDTYPLLNWSEQGELNITLHVKGKITIISYSAAGGQIRADAVNGADGVTSLTETTGEDYLLAAYRKGQSDILNYNIDKEAYTPFTNDGYDDTSPAIDGTGNDALFFTSKRKEKEPTAEQKRTYGFKDTTQLKQGIYLLQNKTITPILTDSIPYIKWGKPVVLSNGQLLVTHTRYGSERFAVINSPTQKGSTYQTISNYQPIQYNPTSNEVSYYKLEKDSMRITNEPADQWIQRTTDTSKNSPWLTDYKNRIALQAKEDSILRAARDNNTSFLDGVLVPKDGAEKSKKREDSISKSQAYDPKKIKPYVLQLHSAYFTAKVNNDYFINRYQPYKNYQGQFKFPELGGMAQGGFTDLLENHHINIAYRLPAATEGSDFFIRYENTAKKNDWSIAYFRKVESLNPDPLRNWTDASGRQYPNVAKIKTHYAEVTTHHPLSYYLSADITEAIRYDRTIFLATDQYSLKYEDIRSIWSITTLALNYNKLKPTLPLLYKGFKVKALTDVFYALDGDEGLVAGNTFQLQYHFPVYKYITIVSQLQAGYSSGQSKVLYNLGGIDNNVTVKVDSNFHAPQNAPYAFQTLITPLRGHLQNTVQGNAYTLLNTDFYFPLFQTLIPVETPLQSVNLLQPGLFIDAATAKETWNAANLNNGKWFWSYGISARTNLAGYPIRFDIAWPGTFSKKPVWYFSLNVK